MHDTWHRAKALGVSETDRIIRFLFLALKRYGIVEQVNSGNKADDPGYQLNADALRWLPGNGEDRPLDRTRLLDEGALTPEVNRYFVECYRNFVELKCVLEAREHTAQVATQDRQEREDRFRDGELPLLFCSPTMELGVDIKQLNLVNLRNVPPTPANYAQRSGRAGRSGQPALVLHLLRGPQPSRSVLLSRARQDGRRKGYAASDRPPQPRPDPLTHPRDLGWRRRNLISEKR